MARSAQRRTARSTVPASGHLRTGERKDLTGITDRLVALQGTVVLERSSFGVAVGIARWDVERVQDAALVHQSAWKGHGARQLRQEPRHDISPGLLAEMKMQSLHGFLCRLLRGKAGPFVA